MDGEDQFLAHAEDRVYVDLGNVREIIHNHSYDNM